MKVLGKTEQPDSRVSDGLLETLPGRSLLLNIDSVSEKSGVSKLLLFLVEPLGSERCIGKEWPSTEGNETGNGTLNDEEPSPPGHALGTIELEDTSRNETSESGCENVSCL